MANVGTSAVRIIDSDNDVVTVTNNRLDVNAVLGASAAIDIGDVSLLLGGTAASVNNGAADATTLRVTIASDTTGVLSVDDNGSTLSIDDGGSTISVDDGGGALTVDGTVTANLSATDNAVLDVIAAPVKAEDTPHSSADKGLVVLSVRRDSYAVGSGADGDYSTLNVSVKGGLYVEQIVHQSLDTFAMIDVDNTEEQLSDTIGTFTDVAEIFLQADEDNSGYVIVGDSDVADNRGMKLNPGDTLILDISDTRTVWLWGSAADQNVRCMLTIRAT